jgi:hypothetical protein
LPEAGKKSVSIDFYRNDIFNMADDFIESDGGSHNILIFENRGFNAYHAAISAQPVFGGPVYFIRNIFYNVPGTAMKYTIRPAGILTYHNTFVADASINNFSNGHFRNNLFIGQHENRPALSGTTYTKYSTLDYNGYRIKNSKTQFRWRYPQHDSLNNSSDMELSFQEFASFKEFSRKTGYESHGLPFDENIFQHVPMPDGTRPGHIYQVEGYDFQLKESAKAKDAGCVLHNINDNYSGKGPDLGAVETGAKSLEYGPRRHK